MNNLSIAISCWHSIVNGTDPLTSMRETTSAECIFSRSAGAILLVVSIFAFIFDIHCLVTIIQNRRVSRRHLGLIIGMVVSSLCVVVISVPSVVFQCFVCHRLCSLLICRMEGFNSFLNGCTAMYLLVVLSLVRLATTANSSASITLQKQLVQQSLYLVLICFLLGGIWSVPPLFGWMSAYVPEGLGFHCGLDWFDKSLKGRLYFFVLFIGVYFIPLTILIFVNVRINRTVHRLTRFEPSTRLNYGSLCANNTIRRHMSEKMFSIQARRLERLNEDRRFIVATATSVIIYLIAWTPYSLVALFQLFGYQYSLHKPWIMTTSALLAKLSMINNPIIYIIVLKAHKLTSTRWRNNTKT